MFKEQSAVFEINRLCVPVMVCHEDNRGNSMTVKQKCERLRETSLSPTSCLVGTMESLSKKMSHLPLLQSNTSSVKISGDDTNRHLESTANGKRAKPDSIPWSILWRNNMATEKKIEDIPKMVELYQCPKFGDIPVPLPHNAAYSAIVAHVIRAQHHLVHKPSLKAVFRNILTSSTMEHFVINSFWWIFLENFQLDRKAQDRLFGQIAENYIDILTQSQSANHGMVFFQDFPNTLSQMLFCCFSCCFPQSCCFRDPAFLTALCSTAYQWTGGLYPAPEVYKQWDFEALEANESNFLQKEKKKETVKKAASRNILDSDLRALTDHRNHTSARETDAMDAHIKVTQCVFNMCGNSPLVQHYMNTMHLSRNIGYNMFVRITRIQGPREGSLTFQDALRQTRQRSACQRRELRALWTRHAQEINNMQQKREHEQNQLLRKQKKVLSQRSVVHKLCQLLVPPAKGEEEIKWRSEQFNTIVSGIE